MDEPQNEPPLGDGGLSILHDGVPIDFSHGWVADEYEDDAALWLERRLGRDVADGPARVFQQAHAPERTEAKMPMIKHNPDGVFPPYRCYSHAIEIAGGSRLLVVSGLNGYVSNGKTLPESFEEQGEAIWNHLGTILRAADMDFDNLVSLRTYLADPQYDEANVRLRMKYLGTHQPAGTVVCCRLLVPEWKLEMEAMAAK